MALAREAITAGAERDLIALIERCGLIDRGGDRSSFSFGWEYAFTEDVFRRCPPIPSGFEAVREAAAALARVEPEDLVQCLLNRYETGSGIDPHTDKGVWEAVVGVSLGSACIMDFADQENPAGEPVAVELPPRSIYLLSGDARYRFTHALRPAPATRWSVTFRSFAPGMPVGAGDEIEAGGSAPEA